MTLSGILVLAMLLPADGIPNALKSFEAIELSFQDATTTSDFAHVAAEYEEFQKANGQSVSVLFNQANAWFRAEEYGRAIAGYEQVLRLTPRDSAAQANLDLALKKAGQSTGRRSNLKFLSHQIFALSFNELACLTTVLLLFSLTLFAIGQLRNSYRTLLIVSCAGTLLAMTLFALKVSSERASLRGVVVADSCEARRGPAGSYDAAFSEPLTDGQRFRVKRKKNDWVEVEILDVGSGWIQSEQALLY